MATPLLTLANTGVNLGDRWLFRHVDVTVSAGDRLCLVGRNGAGKSTLMKLMAGLGEADEGSLWSAPGISVSYLPQAPKLPRGMSLASVVMHGTGGGGGFSAEAARPRGAARETSRTAAEVRRFKNVKTSQFRG